MTMTLGDIRTMPVASGLTPGADADMRHALCETLKGRRVTVWLTHDAAASSRKPGVDYVSIPGMTGHMGEIVRVAKNKNGDIYIRVKDTMRSNGQKGWSWTAVRVNRISDFRVLAIQDNPNAWTGRRVRS